MNSSSRNKLIRTVLKSTLILSGILIVGIAGYGGYLYHKTNAALKQIAAPNPTAAPKPIQAIDNRVPLNIQIPKDTAAPDAQEQDGLKPMIFLLSAIDNRVGSDSLNTDVMMLIALNPITHSATIASLPRDLQFKPVSLPMQKANYYYAYYYGKDKTTAISNTKQFFSDLLQVPIDYMAVINFDGFRQLVDALGGIQIDVDMNMKYSDSSDGTNINLSKGISVLNGKQTLDFVRYRKSNEGTAESSDLERNQRQDQVLNKLLDKLTPFTGITQWGKVLDIAGKNLKTDIPEAILRSWIFQFSDLKPDTIVYNPVVGEWISPYVVPKEADLKQVLSSVRVQVGLSPLDDSYPIADVVGVDSTSDILKINSIQSLSNNQELNALENQVFPNQAIH